ncbi:MAG: stage II sporulation protein M [archaeon]
MKEFFKDNYLKCWEFFLECRWFFVFAFGVFALTFLIGFAFPVFFRVEIFEFIRELILKVEGKTTLDLIVFIFLNNLWASFMAMILGVLFGVFSIVTTVVNGYLLGFVAREAVMMDGIFAMWKIFPHGIFELPAVLFSVGIGMRLGAEVLGIRCKEKGVRNVGYVFWEGLRFFVFVVFPLLVVAGIIEGVLIGIG